MAGSDKHELEFLLLQYMPDELKGEFVNIGVVLLGGGAEANFADVRFTRDWRRVLCLDPGADVEWLQALERDIRMRLQDSAGREDILFRLQDLCSSVIQISGSKGCLGAEPAAEMEFLSKAYLEAPGLRGGRRAPGARRRILGQMRDAFEREGVWQFMKKDIAAEQFTHKGDPLKIDCSYRPNGVIKMFHAVALSSDVDSAKVLAFSYPQLAAGIAREEKAETLLTAVVEDHLDESDEAILFALAMMRESGIHVSAVEGLALIAQQARVELKV